MIRAALDIGTNSVRLLVARVIGGQLKPLYKDLATTRLGEGVHDSRVLSPEAMERTVAAITKFAAIGHKYGAESIVAAATSAVRDAVNGGEFIDLCRLKAGVEVAVLPGTAEARLSYSGATYGQTGNKLTVVVDIGGGSTELALGKGSVLLRNDSVNLGAVRLKDIFPPDGDGVVHTLADINSYIARLLDQVPPAAEEASMIGVGGTITSLAAIDQRLMVYSSHMVHGYLLTAKAAKRHLSQLAAMPLAERRTVPGLQPSRADIIIYGIAILVAIMDKYGVTAIRVSETDILEGLLYSTK